jgi:hypothetical protein
MQCSYVNKASPTEAKARRAMAKDLTFEAKTKFVALKAKAKN